MKKIQKKKEFLFFFFLFPQKIKNFKCLKRVVTNKNNDFIIE